MALPFRWPLAVSSFTLADKAKIAWWTLWNDRFTMGEKVAELERQMSEFSGMRAVMVANGSVANQCVFEMWKVKNPGITPVVICPAVTWISSISPAMMAGMQVVMCDVNLTDFSFDYTALRHLLVRFKDRRVIIWPTALIGFCPDMQLLRDLATKHGDAEVFLDSCENTFSQVPVADAYRKHLGGFVTNATRSILASADITTTSTYFSHMVVSVEGGFVFVRSQEDEELARAFRNHGMVRGLPKESPWRREVEHSNPEVDPLFLFAVAGTNLRPTDVHAMFGLADLKRAAASKAHRVALYRLYESLIDTERFYLPPPQDSHVPFCLPVFTRGRNLGEVKRALVESGTEVRPIVGSHLGYQPALKHLFERPIETAYPNAEWIHRHGLYVGIHGGVTSTMVKDLAALLNSL